MHLKPFALSALHSATSGGRRYHVWMGALTLIMLVGAVAYTVTRQVVAPVGSMASAEQPVASGALLRLACEPHRVVSQFVLMPLTTRS